MSDEQKLGASGDDRPESAEAKETPALETSEASAGPYLIAFVVMLVGFIVYGYLSRP